MGNSAIVTLAIGSNYRAYWQRFCEPSWRAYAARHGLDLLVLTQPQDSSIRALARSPAWQKCLVLSQERTRGYQRVVWLDADIIINERAPSILDGVPEDKVGAVLSGAGIHDDLKPVFLERLGRGASALPPHLRWRADQRSFYAPYGLDGGIPDVVQTGVLVLSPAHHAGLLERIYHADYPEDRCYEQIPLSHALLHESLFHAIDSRFNTVFWERMAVHYPYLDEAFLIDPSLRTADAGHYEMLARLAVRTELANSYFLHLAGAASFARFLE